MQNTTKRLVIWALVVGVLLLVPLIAMQFTAEVNWTGSDFVFAAVALYGAAFAYEMLTRRVENKTHRAVIGLIVFFALAFVWVFAATGFEGIIDRF